VLCDDVDDTFVVKDVEVVLLRVMGLTSAGVLLNNCPRTVGLNGIEKGLIKKCKKRELGHD
jgi:hypothetical protein